jgi:hypothetical protein
MTRFWIPTAPIFPMSARTGVARELTANGGGKSWSGWTMSVQDEHCTELFSLTMSDFGNGN